VHRRGHEDSLLDEKRMPQWSISHCADCGRAQQLSPEGPFVARRHTASVVEISSQLRGCPSAPEHVTASRCVTRALKHITG
jgi:hypothetical protein